MARDLSPVSKCKRRESCTRRREPKRTNTKTEKDGRWWGKHGEQRTFIPTPANQKKTDQQTKSHKRVSAVELTGSTVRPLCAEKRAHYAWAGGREGRDTKINLSSTSFRSSFGDKSEPLQSGKEDGRQHPGQKKSLAFKQHIVRVGPWDAAANRF